VVPWWGWVIIAGVAVFFGYALYAFFALQEQ